MRHENSISVGDGNVVVNLIPTGGSGRRCGYLLIAEMEMEMEMEFETYVPNPLVIPIHDFLYQWSLIAGRLPGRTSNDVKNYWNTHLQKKLITSPRAKPIPKTQKIPKGTEAQPRTHPKSPPRPSPPSNNEILWWDNKIVGPQIDNIGIHWSIDGSIFQEPILGNLQSADDSFLQQNQSDWSDIFIEDVNLWNLLGDD